ncbi:MAG: stage II sporulation protein P [Intestinibacillus sp.]
MRTHTHNPKRRGGIGLPAFICLLCAVGLLAYGRAGGDATVKRLLGQLAENQKFVLGTLALEMGVYPDGASTQEPSTVSASLTNLTHEDVDEVGESGYTPEQAAPSTPVEEMTIPSGASGSTVKINNATALTYDVADMLAHPETIRLNNDGPQVMIIHTHSTEAYTQSGTDTYKPSEASESARTLDKKQSVIRVGDEMAKVLESRGISVVHCRDVFDNPAYSGAYDRSLEAINAQLKKTPSIQVIIDVHRDSIIKDDGTEYKTVCEIDGKKMAQVMLVVGTNAGGLKHDNWRQNLNFAVNLQKRITGAYPTLMRPVNLRKQRFNQSARSPGSMLLEVGSSGNTLAEAIDAGKLFANCLADDLLNA